jgi:hypothetical protein
MPYRTFAVQEIYKSNSVEKEGRRDIGISLFNLAI